RGLRKAEVKAHHFGPRALDNRAHGLSERGKVQTGTLGIGLGPKLPKKRREATEPGPFTFGVDPGPIVTKEIDVDRLVSEGLEFLYHFPRGPRRNRATPDRAQAAAGADGRRETRRAKSSHRRQHERMLDLEQFDKATVWPHHFLLHQQPALAP